MPGIEWRHNRERLLLPIVILPGYNSENSRQSLSIEGLLDTGATGTGIRRDIAQELRLRPKGQRRVYTANGLIVASEYIVRIGFVCGDYTDPEFEPERQQPFVLERERVGFELQPAFAYPVLIGMDILGTGDLRIDRRGIARFDLGD